MADHTQPDGARVTYQSADDRFEPDVGSLPVRIWYDVGAGQPHKDVVWVAPWTIGQHDDLTRIAMAGRDRADTDAYLSGVKLLHFDCCCAIGPRHLWHLRDDYLRRLRERHHLLQSVPWRVLP